MAKLERKNFKVFAENAPLDEMGQFGSAVATTKKNTKDIEEIQELEAWQQGWGSAVISNKNYPPMEEMNGALNVMSYQTAYTLQEGIPEWNKDTVYYIGSIVKAIVDNKVVLYQSLKNENIGNVLDNSEYWEEVKLGGGGLEICDIGMSLYVDESKGLRRYLNGQIVDINTNTQAFLNRLKEITTLHPSLLCTEEQWQTAKTMSALGQVGKFVFNYSGETVVSVRIPRVVNVQGLFDLQNLGMTVEAGLPNIKGQLWTGDVSDVGTYVNGLSTDDEGGIFYKGELVNGYNEGSGSKNYVPRYDFSRASSIYKDDVTTIQPEAIQYPYFIQIATGSETENNIINEIELNNPYRLFDSKNSDHELNNLSWLKSEGQWNAKAVYPTAYDKLLKVYNGTETVEGLSVKLSTEEYTDYDFVLNTAEETFRLPLKTLHTDNTVDSLLLYFYVGETVQNANLIDACRIGELVATKTDMLQASGAGMPSGRYIELTLGASGSTYTAPANGYYFIASQGTSTNNWIEFRNGDISQGVYGTLGWGFKLSLPIAKGHTTQLAYNNINTTNYTFRFVYAEGEV